MSGHNSGLELTIGGVQTEEEIRLANDLMAKAHGGDYFTSSRWLGGSGAAYPGFRREHTRIARYRGEIAGALRLNTETIRLGDARLKMGGLGWVTTAERFRHKGVCRALILDSLDYMRRHNYHVSMLFGIPNFYHRFGFTTTLMSYSVGIDTAEAVAPLVDPHKVREAKPGDIPVLQRLHHNNDEHTACSLVRTQAHITNRWERCKNMRVVTTGHGKVVGYFQARRTGVQLVVDEVGIENLATSRLILAECARMACEECAGRIRFLVPPEHPFARFLLLYNTTHEMEVEHDRGGMMCFVNIGETIENVLPEWEGLLAQSALRNERVEVSLRIDDHSFVIRANRGSIQIAATPGRGRLALKSSDFIHMLTGYRAVDDILAMPRRMVAPDARALLNILFPRRHPYVWPFDRF